MDYHLFFLKSSFSASISQYLDLTNQGKHTPTCLVDSRKWLDILIRIHPKRYV